MSEFKRLVEELGPSGVAADFVEEQSEWAEEHARAIGLTARFVVSRSLLHLPLHGEEEIVVSPDEVVEQIEPKVTFLGANFKLAYDALKVRADMRLVTSEAKLKVRADMRLVTSEAKLRGRKELYIQDGVVKIPAHFSGVDDDTAMTIQNRLHYIGSSRNDNVLDCGLYLDQAEAPYAYTSFSKCERGYQLNALNEATGLSLEPGEVLSMTRAFAFDGSPANSMSKLFHLSHDQIKQDFPECKAVVTALNPFMRFGGGIFTGSSYTPYALSPMEYWYDTSGLYVPRSKGVYPQQLETPPIIWLAHGLDPQTTAAIEKVSTQQIVNVSREEYRNG